MDLATVQAAIAELDRQQKRLINKIAYADKVADDQRARAGRLRDEVSEIQDRLIALIAEERKLTGIDTEENE